MKKVTIIGVVLLLVLGSAVAVLAGEEEVFPAGKYLAARSLENAQFEMASDGLEQALMQNAFANRRVDALEKLVGLARAAEVTAGTEGRGHEVVSLLKDLEGHERALGDLLGRFVPDGDADLDAVEEEMKERGWRLRELISDDYDYMPEGARAGAQKALDNMERAAKMRAAAQESGEDSDAEEDGKPVGLPAGPPDLDLPDVATPPDSTPVNGN